MDKERKEKTARVQDAEADGIIEGQIGRASCRERV